MAEESSESPGKQISGTSSPAEKAEANENLREIRLNIRAQGEGGVQVPVTAQFNLGSEDPSDRPEQSLDVQPQKPLEQTISLPQGRQTIDLRPTVDGEPVYASIIPTVGYYSYILREADGSFVRLQSGISLPARGNRTFSFEVDPIASTRNVLKPEAATGFPCRLSAGTLAVGERPEQYGKASSFVIRHEEHAQNFPYTVSVFQAEEAGGTQQGKLLFTVSSPDGLLPKLSPEQQSLQPGVYVIHVTPIRPHYDQPSLISLQSGNDRAAARQMNFIAQPVRVGAGQEVAITIQQHVKPYNMTLGEYAARDGLSKVRAMLIFPRGYPNMGDYDIATAKSKETIEQKSDLLRIAAEGEEAFLRSFVDFILESSLSPDRCNICEWRRSIILYVRPDAQGNLPDAFRGCTAEEAIVMTDEDREFMKGMQRPRLLEFITDLFRENMEQPYRVENGMALQAQAQEDLQLPKGEPSLKHFTKRDAMRYVPSYLERLRKNDK